MLRALILLVYFTYIVKTLPSLPEHEFSKTVQDGTKTLIINGVKTKTTVKKVFVKLKEGSYDYRKKRVIGKKSAGKVRAQFVCTSCERMKTYTSCFATVLLQEQEEDDEYHLEPDSYPHPDNHACVLSGIEDQVSKFHEQVLDELRNDPCQAIPALYKKTR